MWISSYVIPNAVTDSRELKKATYACISLECFNHHFTTDNFQMNLRAFRNSSFHPEQHANDSQIFAKSQLCSFFVLSINHQTKSNRMMDFSFKELFLVLLVVQIEKTWEFSEAKSFLEFVFFIRRTNSRMDPVKNWNLSTALERKIDIDAAHSACQKFASWRWIIYFGPEIDIKKQICERFII